MGVEGGEQLSGMDAGAEAVGQRGGAGHQLAEQGLGDRDHQQRRGGDQAFPAAAAAEHTPAEHVAGLVALQGGDPPRQARGQHDRAGRSLQHQVKLIGGHIRPADRLPLAEAQQLGRLGQLVDRGPIQIRQQRKTAQQILNRNAFSHGGW